MDRLSGLSEHTVKVPSCPKPLFYLASGPSHGPVVIFVHGWPELSISWRHQLRALGALGFRAIAPDMRGYGRSYVPMKHEEVEHQRNIEDLLGLLDTVKGPGERAVFVGHDWGAPIVWQLATHHPDRVAGAACLCVPHTPPPKEGQPTMTEMLRGLPDAAQWDYQLLHEDEPEGVARELNRDIRRSVYAIFQANDAMPAPRTMNRYITTFDQRKRWKESHGRYTFFHVSTDATVERDARVISQADADRYIEGLERNGFEAPNFYYQNHRANAAYARTAVHNKGVLDMPTLMITAAYDSVCVPELSTNMEEICTRLSRGHVLCGHWAQQERPEEVNGMLVRWLATALPEFWPQPKSKL